MQDRDGGDVEAEQRAGLACVITGRADHMLADDVALVGRDPPFAACGPLKAGDLGVEIDLGAQIPRAFGHGMGHVGRRDMAVIGMIERAQHMLVVEKRAQRPRLRRRQQMCPHALTSATLI